MAKLAAVAARHHARTHAAARWARRRDGSSRENSKDGAGARVGENVAPSRMRVVEVPRPEGPQTWLAATVLPDGTATVTELTAPTESASSVALGAQTKLRGPWDGTEDFIVDVHWTCSGQQSQHAEENRASGTELLVGVSDGTLWRFKIIIGGEHLECDDKPIPIAPSFCAPGLTSFAVDAEGGIWTGSLLSPPTYITRQGQSHSFESAWAGEVTCIFPIPMASLPSSSTSFSPSVLLGFNNDLVALCTSSQEPAFIKYDGKGHGGVKDFVVARDKERFEILCVFADGHVGSLAIDAREMYTRVALPAETTVLAVAISKSTNIENEGYAKQFLVFATSKGIVRHGLEDKSSFAETLVDWTDVLSVATLCCKSKSGCAYLAVLTRSKLVAAACREDETENTQISVTSALRKLESLASREEKLQLTSLELDARLESISKLGVLTSGALACAIRMEVTKSVSCLPFGREAEFGAHDMTRGKLIAVATLTGPRLPPDWTCIVAVEQGSELAPGATAPPPASIFSWRIHELCPTTSTNTSNENECSFSAVVPLRAFSEVPVQVNVWITPRGRKPRGHLIASKKISVLSMARILNSSEGNSSHSHTAEPASRVKRLTQAVRPHAATDQNVQNWPVVLPGPVSDDDASLGRERLRWGEAVLEVIHCDGDIPTLDRVVCSDPALAVAARAAIVEANAAAHVKVRSSFVRDLVQRSRDVEGVSEQLLADLCRHEQTPENCTTSEMIELLQRSWQLYKWLRFGTHGSDQGEKETS